MKVVVVLLPGKELSCECEPVLAVVITVLFEVNPVITYFRIVLEYANLIISPSLNPSSTKSISS